MSDLANPDLMREVAGILRAKTPCSVAAGLLIAGAERIEALEHEQKQWLEWQAWARRQMIPLPEPPAAQTGEEKT